MYLMSKRSGENFELKKHFEGARGSLFENVEYGTRNNILKLSHPPPSQPYAKFSVAHFSPSKSVLYDYYHKYEDRQKKLFGYKIFLVVKS